jgi:hypothetical protein
MKPRVLIVTTCRWFTAARLVMAFAQIGCNVDILCPPGHPAIGLKSLHGWRRYRMLAPLVSIRSCLRAIQPDVIVPCDDLATLLLHQLYAEEQGKNSATSARTLELIDRSLGQAGKYSLTESRSSFLATAREEDVDTPETVTVSSEQEIRDWVDLHPFPLVLKADGTSGGEGVKIAYTLDQALRAYAILRAPVSALIVAKRTLIDRDWNLLRPWFRHKKRTVSMQRFVEGRDANVAIACWQGRILASISAEVVKTGWPKGPAAVIRIIDNKQMQLAAEKLVRRLNLSGLCGLDFMIDDASGIARLIEINARATQTCHLALGHGRDLVSALCSEIAGRPFNRIPIPGITDTIALFPLAWQHEPSSSVLKTAYHDVPWEEPQLVRAGVAKQSRFTLENAVAVWSRIRPGRRLTPLEKHRDA